MLEGLWAAEAALFDNSAGPGGSAPKRTSFILALGSSVLPGEARLISNHLVLNNPDLDLAFSS